MSPRTLRFMVLAAATLTASACLAETDGQVTFGAHWWRQTVNEAEFREFREVPRGGFLESFLLSDRQAPWALTVAGRNAPREDQAYDVMFARGIRWRVDLAYQEIP